MATEGDPTVVVNIRSLPPDPSRWPAGAVYIGRQNRWRRLPRSPWANPYSTPRHGDRATVIAKFEAWLRGQPALLARLPELRGKRLVCWCAPEQPCHGDVLARLAAGPVLKTVL